MNELIAYTQNLPKAPASQLPATVNLLMHQRWHGHQDFGYLFFIDHPVHHQPWFIPLRSASLPAISFPIGLSGIFPNRSIIHPLKFEAIDEALGVDVPPSLNYIKDWMNYMLSDYPGIYNYKLNCLLAMPMHDDSLLEIGLVGTFPRDYGYEFDITSGSFPRWRGHLHVDNYLTRFQHNNWKSTPRIVEQRKLTHE